MAIVRNSSDTGDIVTNIANQKHAVSDGSNLVESSLTEDGTLISTTKDFFANTVTTAQASLKIGPALTLSSGGGELLQQSQISENLEYSIIPSKIYTAANGTAGQLTTGKNLTASIPEVLNSGFSLRSDDPSADVYPNNVAGKVQTIFTAPDGRWVTEFRLRFDTVQTGIRQVARIGDENGPIVFESEPIQSFNAGIGITSKVYAGTPETETVFDFSEAPWVLYPGETYHITWESSVGDLVMLGDLVGGEFKPYVDRDIATLTNDPVVSHAVYPKSENFDMVGLPWHSQVAMDTTTGDKTVTLPTAEGLLAKGMFIYVRKSDLSANKVTVYPFSGQTIDGETSVDIEYPRKSAVFFSDGTEVHSLDLNTNEFTDDEKDKLASLTGGRFLGVFANESALTTAYPTGVEGDNALVTATNTTWFWNGSAWEDSTVGSTGDMTKAVYDPTAKNASAFSMANMDETASFKIMSDAERSAIAANTAKVSADGSVTTHSDVTDSGSGAIITSSERSNLSNQSGTNTGDVTLNVGSVTQESLGLTGQELTANQATTSTDGVMSSEDKTKLDNLVANGAGDSWVSGLTVVAHSPVNQTVDYTSGSYLIDGSIKTVATGGVYDLENAFGTINHYSGMVTSQHAIVKIYVDSGEVIKSIRGNIVEKNEVPNIPQDPTDSVCIALVHIKVNSSSVPRNIVASDVTDCRFDSSFITNEFVKVSELDTTTGHLRDKLSDNGDVTFTIENSGGDESLKADVDSSVITAKSLVTTVGTDYMLVSDTSDSGNLKKALVSDVLGAGSTPYTELYEDAGTTASTGWVTIATPTSYLNKILHVLIYSESNTAQIVGVRAVGSSLERSFSLGKGTGTTFTVKTDGSGNFQIKSGGDTDIHFKITDVNQ